MKTAKSRKTDLGQGMIEYTLIIGLLAIFVMAVMMAVGPAINDVMQSSVNSMTLNSASAAISSQFYASSSAPVVIDPLTGLPI